MPSAYQKETEATGIKRQLEDEQTATLTVRVATWLQYEEAASRSTSVAAQPQTLEQ